MRLISKALLALEDGRIFRGRAFGALGKTVTGEAVFNTSMTGYQEILTDPSYAGQIVSMTSSQIGNYGTNPDDEESDGPKVRAFAVRDLSPMTSNWRSTESLSDYLERHGIPGITGLDTRALTKRLRVSGAMKACLSTDESISEDELVDRAKAWEGLEGVDYVREVTTDKTYTFEDKQELCEPFSVVGTTLYEKRPERKTLKIAALDFGAKRSIFRRMLHHDLELTIYPASTPAKTILESDAQGLFLSNGPGDPSAVTYAHETVRELIEHFPTFGICLGHQIITHAIGAKTYKLKFGHRGGNQPVKNIETGRVAITAQNHGFCSTQEELEKCGAVVTELNLNDQTVAGLRLKDKPVFSVQYHPEAGPGPNDATHLFEDFYKLVEEHGRK